MLANLTKTTHWQVIFLAPMSETRITAASSRICSSTSNVSDLSVSFKKKAAKRHHRSGSAQGGGGGTSAVLLKVPISAEPADCEPANIVRAAGLSVGNTSCYRTCCKMLSNRTEMKLQRMNRTNISKTTWNKWGGDSKVTKGHAAFYFHWLTIDSNKKRSTGAPQERTNC